MFVDLTDEEEARQPSHINGIPNLNAATRIHVKSPQLLNSSIGTSPMSVNIAGRNVQVIQGMNENRVPIQRLAPNQFGKFHNRLAS